MSIVALWLVMVPFFIIVPLLLGVTLFSALFVCVGNMVANLLYGVIDPQIREGEE